MNFPVFPAIFQGLILAITCGLTLMTKPWVRVNTVIATGEPESALSFLWAFAAMTVLVIFLLRLRLGPKIFSALFLLAVFFGVMAIGLELFGELGAIILFSVSVLVHYGLGRVWTFDLILALGLAGVALNFGRVMEPITAVAVLLALSIYDVLAVLVSKHMVDMAKRLMDSGTPFAFVIPLKFSGLKRSLASVRSGSDFLMLGTGDVILPTIMVVSSARLGMWYGLAVIVGALIGLSVNLVIFFIQERPRPIPALPAPAIGSVLAYFLVTIFIS